MLDSMSCSTQESFFFFIINGYLDAKCLSSLWMFSINFQLKPLVTRTGPRAVVKFARLGLPDGPCEEPLLGTQYMMLITMLCTS
jgi:hypothetical protein